MPCCYDWDVPEELWQSQQNGNDLEKFIYSLFFNDQCGDRDDRTGLGKQLVSLEFRTESNSLNRVGKIRMALGSKKKILKERVDEFGYLIALREYLGIIEVDSNVGTDNTLKFEDREVIERMAISIASNYETNVENIGYETKEIRLNNQEFIRNHVICEIFEFIETKELIESCSNVCKYWHELIIYNRNCTEQIFGNRFKHFARKLEIEVDIENIREIYTNLNWMEIYLCSGMFHLEIDPKYHDWTISRPNAGDVYLSLLFLNPLTFLELSSNHFLFERFVNYKKFLVFSEQQPPLDLIHRYKSRKYCNILLKETDLTTKLHRIIHTPLILPPNGRVFSINFESEIPLYIDFLKEITIELSPIVDVSKSLTIATILDKMFEKASYFLLHHTTRNYRVGKDVLIGLHLIFLDRYYIGDNTLMAPYLNFGKLLKNLKLNQGELFENYPEHLSTDLFSHLTSSIAGLIQTWNPIQYSPFNHPLNAFEFLKEHVFELSSISDSIPQLVHQHLQLMQHDELTFPNKHSDLILHYHLLHPQHYIQDCVRLLPNHTIKYHDFNFLHHQNLKM